MYELHEVYFATFLHSKLYIKIFTHLFLRLILFLN